MAFFKLMRLWLKSVYSRKIRRYSISNWYCPFSIAVRLSKTSKTFYIIICCSQQTGWNLMFFCSPCSVSSSLISKYTNTFSIRLLIKTLYILSVGRNFIFPLQLLSLLSLLGLWLLYLRSFVLDFFILQIRFFRYTIINTIWGTGSSPYCCSSLSNISRSSKLKS